MDDRTARPLPPLRPERQFAPETMGKIGDVARPLTFIERLTNMTLVRRLAVISCSPPPGKFTPASSTIPCCFRRSATRSPRSGIPPRTAC